MRRAQDAESGRGAPARPDGRPGDPRDADAGRDVRESGDVDGESRRTTQDDTGLSFEAEPTGLSQRPAHGDEQTNPARDASRAAWTPGPSVDEGGSVWTRGVVRVLIALAFVGLIAIVFAVYA